MHCRIANSKKHMFVGVVYNKHVNSVNSTSEISAGNPFNKPLLSQHTWPGSMTFNSMMLLWISDGVTSDPRCCWSTRLMVEELSHLTGVATGRISRRSSRILTSQGFWHVSLNVFKFITNSKTAKTAIFINPSMSPKKVQICIKLSKKQGDMGGATTRS